MSEDRPPTASELFHLPSTPARRDDIPTYDLARDEHKVVSDAARFTMAHYMQGLGLYLVFVGLIVRELVTAANMSIEITWAIAATILNVLAVYGATWFRSMAYHYLDRESVLADHLGFQRPHPMIWGYKAGVLTFALVQVLVVLYLLLA